MANGAHARELPMTERDDDLSQLEAELTQEEAALGSELTRMMAAATELERKVKTVKAVLAEAAMSGEQDPSLAKRVNATKVPPLELDELFENARRARLDAIENRRRASEKIRERAAEWKQQMSALNAQIQNDEKSAQRLAVQIKKSRAVGDETPAVRAMPPALKRSAKAGTPPASPRAAAPTQPAVPAVELDATVLKKRQAQRVKMQAAIDLHSDNNFFSGFSANISEGGVFIATVDHVPMGTTVDLSFSLPTGEKVQAAGVVRWVREINDKDPDSFPGVGVQFTQLDPSAADAIHRFISQRDPMFYVD